MLKDIIAKLNSAINDLDKYENTRMIKVNLKAIIEYIEHYHMKLLLKGGE